MKDGSMAEECDEGAKRWTRRGEKRAIGGIS